MDKNISFTHYYVFLINYHQVLNQVLDQVFSECV